MKFILALVTLATNMAFASDSNVYLCTSKSPKGAIALELNENGKSWGRLSNPWTRNYEALLGDDSSQYNKLNVGFVEKQECEDCFTFNADIGPLPLNNLGTNAYVLEVTKSYMSYVRNPNTGRPDLSLKHYIGNDRYMTLNCKKI